MPSLKFLTVAGLEVADDGAISGRLDMKGDRGFLVGLHGQGAGFHDGGLQLHGG